MTTITFDTLKFANRLKAAGVPPQQAEAEAEVLAEVLAEAVKTSDLATKNDISEATAIARKEINEAEMRIIKWVVAMGIAQMAFLVGVMLRMPS
jgi:hypothetical protein